MDKLKCFLAAILWYILTSLFAALTTTAFNDQHFHLQYPFLGAAIVSALCVWAIIVNARIKSDSEINIEFSKTASEQKLLALTKLSDVNKYEINAAITRLIETEGYSQESAKIVGLVAGTVPLTLIRQLRETSKKGKKRNLFTAFTPEMGNVGISDDPKLVNSSSNVLYERIGEYTLWRTNPNQVCIRYFWKSDISTRINPLNTMIGYALDINDSLEPQEFHEIVREFTLTRSHANMQRYKFKDYTVQLTGSRKGARKLHGLGMLEFTIDS